MTWLRLDEFACIVDAGTLRQDRLSLRHRWATKSSARRVMDKAGR